MEEKACAREDPEELLEQAIARLEEDPAFDLDAFLREHAEVEDKLRTRLEKLFRHGLLLRLPRARRVLERLSRRYSKAEDEAVLGGRYGLHEEIGRGGSNRVYRAFDRDLERDVAIKVVEPHGEALSAVSLDRLLAEARVTGQLEHPGIVPVHDLGVMRDGRLYFAMKRVEGRTLRDLIAELNEGESETRADYPLPRLIEIVERIAEALAYAHDRGVVHRDLKPANVMVGRFGEVQLVDWGLARMLDVQQARESSQARLLSTQLEADDWAATRTGDVYGTPSYMSPEQAAGQVDEIDERTDIFGVGALLYHLLSGNAPYWGATGEEVIERATQCRLNDPRFERALRPVPRELRAVCRRALARERESRYPSVQELAKDLRAYDEGRPGAAWKDPFSQRVVKWVRRNPVYAVLAVATLLVAFGARVAQVKAAESVRLAAEHSDDALRDDLIRLMRWIDVGPIEVTPTARALVTAFQDGGYPLDGAGTPTDVAQAVHRLARWEGDHYRWAVAALYNLDYLMALAGWAHGALLLEGAELEYLTEGGRSTAKLMAESDPGFCRFWLRLGEILAEADDDPWRQDVRERMTGYVTGGVDRLDAVLADEGLADRSGLDLAWLGYWLRNHRDGDEGLSVLELAAKRSPDTFRVQAYLATHAYYGKDYTEAVRRGSMALAIDPSVPSASNNLCEFLRKLGNLEEAIEVGRRAIELGPKNPSAFNNLGLALMNFGQQKDDDPELLQEAVQMLQKAVSLDPRYANGWENLSQTYFAIEDYPRAIEAAERSLKEDPGNLDPLLLRALAHDRQGDKARATETAVADCREHPNEPRLWLAAGARMLDLGQLLRGYAYYREALRLDLSGVKGQMGKFVPPAPTVQRLSPELGWALGRVTPRELEDWYRVGSLAAQRHEFGRSAEAYAALLDTWDGSPEDLRVLSTKLAVAPWRLSFEAARSAAMAASGEGFAHVPGVAWMEEADPALVDQQGLPIRVELRALADRPLWADSARATPERRAEALARSIEWLGLSLDAHWEDMKSETPQLEPKSRSQTVSAWLGRPELTDTLAGSRNADGDTLADEIALLLEHAEELGSN